jgi:hypothetical protein
MIAKNIHQPAAHVTKAHAPAAWKGVEVTLAIWHTTHSLLGATYHQDLSGDSSVAGEISSE